MRPARPLPWAEIARWAGGLALFLSLMVMLSGEVAAIAPVTRFLDGIGFDAGRWRVSPLTVLRLVVTVVALWMIVRLVNRGLRRVIRRAPRLDATQRLLAEKLAGIAVAVAAFFFGIDLLGIDLTALAVFSGAFGLAVGFGLQKTFGNLIAGIILLMDRSIKPGDVIALGDNFGHVNRIGVRAVSVITRDGKEHLIPNENLMTQEVENWSFSDRNVRLHIPVGVSYHADIHLAQKLMIEAATKSRRVLPDPRPSVWLRGFEDGAARHDILVWIADPELGTGSVQSDVLNRVWEAFRANGIEIPYPQRDLNLRNWPQRD